MGNDTEDVSANDINTRQALAQLPVTRKSDLKTLQQQQLPFGGLTTTAPRTSQDFYVARLGIFDPEGTSPDWWRFAHSVRRACAAVI